MHEPDDVFIQLEPTGDFARGSRRGDHWMISGVEVEWNDSVLAVTATRPLARVAVRWKCGVSPQAAIFGDAWERTYGDSTWSAILPHRVLPWLWLADDSASGVTTGAGVKTLASAWCSWTVDVDGITLWADVRSGQAQLELRGRRLELATVVSVSSSLGAYDALDQLTEALATIPAIESAPLVGSNNWYYAYGQGFDSDAVVADAREIVSLAAGHPVAPFGVIDAGWGEGSNSCDGGPWEVGKQSFLDMRGVAERIAAEGARPGLWYRPLLSRERSPLSHDVYTDVGFPMDPSLPAVLESVMTDIRRFRDWGYELIKHDFSTFDITGSFAPHFGPTMGAAQYTFADRSRTTAEITTAFYRAIREAAGDATVIGCNTVGHWSAGLATASRIGDDTSGKQWERTRRMGVNAMAARLPQHGRFFVADADCVAATPATDWGKNRQFLDLVAQSGTALFLSLDPRSLNDEVRRDVSNALQVALDGGAPGGVRPLDFRASATPRRWSVRGREVEFDWSGPMGAEPWIHGV